MKCGSFRVRLHPTRKPIHRAVTRRLRLHCKTTSAESLVKVKFTIPHHVDYGQSICILGGVTELGEWDVKKSPCLTWSEGDVWSGIVELPPAPIEYKYFIKNEDGTPAEWQPCGNLTAEIAEGDEMEIDDIWEGTMQETTTPIETTMPLETKTPLEMPTPPTAESIIPESVEDLVEEAEVKTKEVDEILEEAEEMKTKGDSVSVEI